MKVEGVAYIVLRCSFLILKEKPSSCSDLYNILAFHKIPQINIIPRTGILEEFYLTLFSFQGHL